MNFVVANEFALPTFSEPTILDHADNIERKAAYMSYNSR